MSECELVLCLVPSKPNASPLSSAAPLVRVSRRMPPKRLPKCLICKKVPRTAGCSYALCETCCRETPSEVPTDVCAIRSHRPVAERPEDRDEVKGPPKAGGDETTKGALAALSAGLEEAHREIRALRAATMTTGGAGGAVIDEDTESEDEPVLSIHDVAFRPSRWIRAVLGTASTREDAVSRVDALMTVLDRKFRIAELLPDGLPAHASARAMEAVRRTLMAIATSPADADRLEPVLMPMASILYGNLVLLTHGKVAAIRWHTLMAERAATESEFMIALRALPAGLRLPREERVTERGWRARRGAPSTERVAWGTRPYVPGSRKRGRDSVSPRGHGGAHRDGSRIPGGGSAAVQAQRREHAGAREDAATPRGTGTRRG